MIEILLVLMSEHYAPICSDEKKASIAAPPRYENGQYIDPVEWVSCSLKLEEGQKITRPLRFVGRGILFDCNGGEIELESELLNQDVYPISVGSDWTLVDGYYKHTQSRDITVTNTHETDSCEVNGPIRIRSTGYAPTPEHDPREYKNSRGPQYVKELRDTTPTRITFDNIHINYERNGGSAVYFEQGVTHSAFINSTIDYDSNSHSVYLAPEGGFNRIENNVIIHRSYEYFGYGDEEAIVIDGSEGNIIKNNWIDSYDGGIFLFRNCGEDGQIRYTGAWRNVIEGNTFYWNGSLPPNSESMKKSIIIGERNGDAPGFHPWPFSDYCDDESDEMTWTISDVDPSWNWYSDWESSSSINLDFARDNRVIDNFTCNRSPESAFDVKNSSHNFGTYWSGNMEIACE